MLALAKIASLFDRGVLKQYFRYDLIKSIVFSYFHPDIAAK